MLRAAISRLLQWAFGTPVEEVTTGIPELVDGVPVAAPEPHTVLRTTLANGEVWELPLATDPGAR